ncbi:MAG: circadian clock KaiB family protein [Deltaproteobacteria bacterium]|nr:circadian clock KaiB family protein [Deltaproteobacteria bacterium]
MIWSRAAKENPHAQKTPICKEHLEGRYDLKVIDLYQQPQMAAEDQIVAVPTLIKDLPLPTRRLVGDLSMTERVLAGLDISKTTGV